MGSVAKTSGTATAGFLLALLGTVLLATTFLPLGFGWVPVAIGATFLCGGVGLVVVGLRKPEPVLAFPPAHVTFYQQHKRDLPLPVTASATPARAASSAELEPITADDLEISRLDVQIREVNRKINKATVMLGTGKLSDEGYRRYVENLKSERADLEGQKVRLEMARADG